MGLHTDIIIHDTNTLQSMLGGLLFFVFVISRVLALSPLKVLGAKVIDQPSRCDPRQNIEDRLKESSHYIRTAPADDTSKRSLLKRGKRVGDDVLGSD